MMFKRCLASLLVGLLFALASCASDETDQGKPVAKINDVVISQQDFVNRLTSLSRYRDVGALSPEDRLRLLEQEVDKELLIQEAIRMGLTREEAFRDAIERYWEQTLITTLIKRKTDSLEDKVLITSEEVENRYRELVKANPDLPSLNEIKDSLVTELREEKKTKAIEDWLAGLRREADIKIFKENLNPNR